VRRHDVWQPQLAFQNLLDGIANTRCAAAFVIVAVVLAGDGDGVERNPSVVV
jgi:hypothetical protein